MKTSEKIAIGALAALAVGAVAWAVTQNQKPAPTPSQTPGAAPALPSNLTPVTTLTAGQKYTYAAITPAGINDAAALTAALASSGWTSPQVDSFNGAGFPYVAHGTWSGATGPVPVGVVAGQ